MGFFLLLSFFFIFIFSSFFPFFFISYFSLPWSFFFFLFLSGFFHFRLLHFIVPKAFRKSTEHVTQHAVYRECWRSCHVRKSWGQCPTRVHVHTRNFLHIKWAAGRLLKQEIRCWTGNQSLAERLRVEWQEIDVDNQWEPRLSIFSICLTLSSLQRGVWDACSTAGIWKQSRDTHKRVRRKWFWYYLGSSGSMDNKMLVMEFRDPLICFFLT